MSPIGFLFFHKPQWTLKFPFACMIPLLFFVANCGSALFFCTRSLSEKLISLCCVLQYRLTPKSPSTQSIWVGRVERSCSGNFCFSGGPGSRKRTEKSKEYRQRRNCPSIASSVAVGGATFCRIRQVRRPSVSTVQGAGVLLVLGPNRIRLEVASLDDVPAACKTPQTRGTAVPPSLPSLSRVGQVAKN